MYLDTKELSNTPARIDQWHELAEAIRLGCKLRPVQCFGQTFDASNAACAVGAAVAAMNGGILDIIPDMPSFRKVGGCPCCSIVRFAQDECIIPHLNDDHRWTREAIADWLDTL